MEARGMRFKTATRNQSRESVLMTRRREKKGCREKGKSETERKEDKQPGFRLYHCRLFDNRLGNHPFTLVVSHSSGSID